MSTKSFNDYLQKRLSNEEVRDIKAEAKVEFKAIRSLQSDVSSAVSDYMKSESVGFNEFARKLGKSPSHISKIIRGEANLTLTSVAQIYAAMGLTPHIVAS